MDEKIENKVFTNQKVLLEAYSRTLSRESYVLMQYPNSLWQHMFNRLRWEEILQSEDLSDSFWGEYRSRVDDPHFAWFENRARNKESKELRQILSGHRRIMVSCGYSLDGSLIYSASSDGDIRIWESRSGKEIRDIACEHMLRCCDFSPDGRTLAVGLRFNLQLRDMLTGAVNYEFRYHNEEVNDCVFSSDGNLIAAAMGSMIQIYDVCNGELAAELPPKDNQGKRSYRWNRCAFSPDGNLVAAVSQQDHVFCVWNIRTSKEIHREYRNYALSLAFSPDSSYLGSASRDVAGLRDAKNLTKIMKLEPYGCRSQFCLFSPDGKLFIAAYGKKIRLWDVNSKKMIYELTGHTADVTCCAISPDGKHLISGSRDQTLRVWDISQILQSKFEIPDERENYWGSSEHLQAIKRCAISKDSSTAVTTDGNIILLWDLDSAEPKFSPLVHKAFSCAFSRDSSSLITKGKDVIIWDVNHGTKKLTINSGPGKVADQSLSADGSFLALQHDQEKGNIQVWRLSDGKLQFSGVLTKNTQEVSNQGKSKSTSILGVDVDEYRNIYAGSNLSMRQVTENPSCIFSPDGKLLASNYGGKIRLWDAVSGKQSASLVGHHNAVNDLRFTRNGKFLLSASDDGTIRLWNTKSGAEAQKLSGHKGKVNVCFFSPDEKMIVSGGEDGTIRLWDTKSGVEKLVLRGHIGNVIDGAFFLNDHNLLSAGSDKTIQLWDTQTGEAKLKFSCLGAVTSLACSSAANCIIAGDESGAVYFLELHREGIPSRTTGRNDQSTVWNRDNFSEAEERVLPRKSQKQEPHLQLPQPESVSKDLTDTVREAINGNLDAIAKMADCYLLGKGVPRDHDLAFKLFSEAAEKGNIEGLMGLGLCYKDGVGVKKDLTQAASLYLKAAEGGSVSGQIFTAFLYLDGTGVSKNLSESTVWFKRAAENNSVIGMFELGRSYALGRGVPKNNVLAMQWIQKAADNGYAPAKRLVKDSAQPKSARIVENKPLGPATAVSSSESKLTQSSLHEPKQKETAQVIAYRNKAEKGDPSAQMMLGTFYANGRGVEKDLVEAAKWYRKAADAGHAPSQLLMGTCYSYGNGVSKDAAKAVEYYQKAALAGNRMAQYRLGECYEKGAGVARDMGQAIQWYKKAADQDSVLAKNRLKRLEGNQSPTTPSRSTFQSPRNYQKPKAPIRVQPTAAGNSGQSTLLGKQAAALRSQGDLKGALKLYKEQEKVFRGQANLPSLKANLMIQNEILKEILDDLNNQLRKKQGK